MRQCAKNIPENASIVIIREMAAGDGVVYFNRYTFGKPTDV